MRYGLGIDAGGTYTDGVIYDFDENKVLRSTKWTTNREDLGKSINAVLDNLPNEELKEIKLVALSTTLATNSAVEGKGRKATLILIGCDKNIVNRFGHNYGLTDLDEIVYINGEHGSDGDIKVPPDWEGLKQKLEERRNSTNAFAIVELGGIYNPEFEIAAKELVESITGLTAVHANAVTRELNFMKRAASTLINAQLIPIINEFLDSVRYNLDIRHIDAPLVIVRGDGTLMSEEYTRAMPVETLMSGPAASVLGAVNLSSRKDCIVVDMGGTTSDIAIVSGGMVKFAHKGLSIGKWETGTRSMDIKPVGLGGDSHITFDKEDKIVISSRRAIPLCYLADKSPEIIQEMNNIFSEARRNTLSLCEFFVLTKDIQDTSMYNKLEVSVIEALRNGPLSIKGLAQACATSVYELKLERLEKFGTIIRSALTPTDIMHITGMFDRWNKNAALLGANILAQRLEITLQELIHMVNFKVKEKLYLNILGVLLEDENEEFKAANLTEQTLSLLLKGFRDKKERKISISFSSELDLVGIGAPIHIFLPEIAEKLNTRCVIPEYASVANAVGAITGSIVVEETVVIRPVYESHGISRYVCFSSIQSNNFINYENAVIWARSQAEKIAYDKALQRGSGKISIVTKIDEKEFASSYSSVEVASSVEHDLKRSGDIIDSDIGIITGNTKGQSLLLETNVTARAVGTLKWL